MVATASTEHSYWLALAVFVYATHATQAIAFEWKPGLSYRVPVLYFGNMCRCRRRPTGKAMAELAASVGHQLIHVDYDNNKHDYNNDNSVHSSSVRCIHQDPVGGGGSGSGGGGGGDPSCLVDLNPNDFQSLECPPVCLAVSAVDMPRSTGDDLTVMSCDTTTSNTPCAHCGLHLYHRHHHHHHHGHPPAQQQSLVYGQFCVDGSFSDDSYPAGLRTPQ